MSMPFHNSRNRGATAVEFALVMPLFAWLVFGIIEFGWYFFVQHTIQYATREGTRLALVGGQLQDDNGTYMTREASIVKTVKNCASLAVTPSALQISIYPVGTGYTDPAQWETTVNAGSGGDYMRVRVRYVYTFLTPFIGRLFPPGTREVSAQSLYRNEQF
jgi:Flp pilus assembly protein TadG